MRDPAVESEKALIPPEIKMHAVEINGHGFKFLKEILKGEVSSC